MAIQISGDGIELASLASTAQAALKSGRKNLIINGDMRISQRGDYSTTPKIIPSSQPTYVLDRWLTYGSNTIVHATQGTTTLPNGTHAYTFKSEATQAGGSWLHPYQKIEWDRSYRGKTITLSCWVKTNLAGQGMRVCDYAGCFVTGSIPSDETWNYVSATFTLSTGDPSSGLIQVHPAFGGSSVVGSYIEFTHMQVELGDTATDFEHRSYGEELALCQRYFQIVYAHSVMTHYVGAWSRYYGIKTLPVEMRTNPTPSPKFTRATNYQPGGGSGTSVGISSPDPSTLDFSWYGNSNGFNDVKFNTADTGDKRIFCDAEL